MNMNKLLLITALLFGVLSLQAQAGESFDPEAFQTPDEETRAVTLDITGMT